MIPILLRKGYSNNGPRIVIIKQETAKEMHVLQDNSKLRAYSFPKFSALKSELYLQYTHLRSNKLS